MISWCTALHLDYVGAGGIGGRHLWCRVAFWLQGLSGHGVYIMAGVIHALQGLLNLAAALTQATPDKRDDQQVQALMRILGYEVVVNNDGSFYAMPGPVLRDLEKGEAAGET